MVQTLLDSTITILDILIEKYKDGLLNYDDFISHSKIKVYFLSEHIQQLMDEDERIHAQDILESYFEIIDCSPYKM